MKDVKDFSILKTVTESDRHLWKKRIHEIICRNLKKLPITEKFSFQTVCRRIKQLETRNFLESYHKNIKQVNRSLIHVYKTTEKGKNSLKSYRALLLRKWVKDEKERGMTENFIREAFARHYQIPEKLCKDCSIDFLRKTAFLTENYRETSALENPDFLIFINQLVEHSPIIQEKIGSLLEPAEEGYKMETDHSPPLAYLSLRNKTRYSDNDDNNRQRTRRDHESGDGRTKRYRPS